MGSESRVRALIPAGMSLGKGPVAIELQLAPAERYACISRTLRRFGYTHLKRSQKAVVLRFLERVSSYSREQLITAIFRSASRI